MAAISGVGGTATIGSALTDVKKWTMNPKSENGAYASSGTAGWKKRLPGTKDISGTIELVHQDAKVVAACKPGATVTLSLVCGAQTYSGPCIIDDVSIETDIDTGAPVGLNVNWSGNGAWADF